MFTKQTDVYSVLLEAAAAAAVHPLPTSDIGCGVQNWANPWHAPVPACVCQTKAPGPTFDRHVAVSDAGVAAQVQISPLLCSTDDRRCDYHVTDTTWRENARHACRQDRSETAHVLLCVHWTRISFGYNDGFVVESSYLQSFVFVKPVVKHVPQPRNIRH
jgi:hypothetical protein